MRKNSRNHPLPWKSGASAPRKPFRICEGFSPCAQDSVRIEFFRILIAGCPLLFVYFAKMMGDWDHRCIVSATHFRTLREIPSARRPWLERAPGSAKGARRNQLCNPQDIRRYYTITEITWSGDYGWRRARRRLGIAIPFIG